MSNLLSLLTLVVEVAALIMYISILTALGFCIAWALG